MEGGGDGTRNEETKERRKEGERRDDYIYNC